MGKEIVDDYNEIHMMELESVKVAKLESWMAKGVGETLMGVYPNRQWGVRVDLEGQMICVTCPSVSNEKGYYISMVGRSLHDLQEEAKRAAGEILERYNLSRERKFNPDVFETLDRDLSDEVISSDAAPEPITKRIIT
jgi:hypothetical protein